MKKIWHCQVAVGFLKIFLLFLTQPLFGALQIEREGCESGFERNISQEDFTRDYLLRHLPDVDKILTEEREKELVYIYQNGVDQEKKQRALIELLSGHIKLIRKFAYRIAGSWGRRDFAEDLIQDAVFRLTQFIEIHDSESSRIVSYILTYIPKIMNTKMSRYVAPALVSDRYKGDMAETEDFMMPVATELINRTLENGNDDIEDTSLKPVENWAEASESIKQIENFILRIGTTVRERYILRHRVFTFQSEPAPSIAKKFEVHPSGVAIREEEKKLIEKISEYLGNESLIEPEHIFIEVNKRINEEGLPLPVNNSELDWQTKDLIRQIKYIIQEMDNTSEQRHNLKDQQASSLAEAVGLEEIDQQILRYRLLEEPSRKPAAAVVSTILGISKATVLSREKAILKKLEETEFISPELKKIVEDIHLAVRQKIRFVTVDKNEIDQITENLARRAGLDEIEQHILRYRFLEGRNAIQTLVTIGKVFGITKDAVWKKQKGMLKKLEEAEFTSDKLKRIVEKIFMEEEQKNISISTTMDKSEMDQLAENLAKQVEDFILEIGNTPREVYTLRHRIFTFQPESFLSIAKKFNTYKGTILLEEQRLLKRTSEFLSGKPNMSKDQIFREVVSRIRKGEFFFFLDRNEINRLAESIANQAKLNKIEKYILIYQFLENSSNRQTAAAIGEIFGISKKDARRREKSMLEKLKKTKFKSSEQKEIVERILLTKEQRKRLIPIVDKERFIQEQDTLPEKWKQDAVHQYIFEYRLLKDPGNRKTLAEIAKIFNVSQVTIHNREKAILRILQERGLVSFQ